MFKRLFGKKQASDSDIEAGFRKERDLFTWIALEAPSRGGDAITPGFLVTWARALSESTFGVCSALAKSETLPDFGCLLTDRSAAMRVAAFVAWWFSHRTVDDHPEIYSEGSASDGAVDETGRMMVRDMYSVASAMYPVGDDSLVQKAIALDVGGTPEIQNQCAWADSIVALATGGERVPVVLPDDPSDPAAVSAAVAEYEAGMRHITALTATLVGFRQMPMERLQALYAAEDPALASVSAALRWSRSATSRCVDCRDNVAAVGLEPGEPHVAGEGFHAFVLAQTYGRRKIASLLGAESFPKGTGFGTTLRGDLTRRQPTRKNLIWIASPTNRFSMDLADKQQEWPNNRAGR